MFKFIVFACIFISLLSSPVMADRKNAKAGGFMDFNIYPYLSDVDNDSVFTLNLAATLDHGFSYFSLTNFANQTNSSELSDTITYYSEHNLRWQINSDSAFDLTYQANLRSGTDNDRHRLGVRWRLNDSVLFGELFRSWHLVYAINLHALQFDDGDSQVWQIEHAFRLTFPNWNERVYVGGFIDHTFNEDLPANIPSNPIVAEIQTGYRLVDNFYAVAEYRINQYRRSDVNNVGVGLQYLMRW